MTKFGYSCCHLSVVLQLTSKQGKLVHSLREPSVFVGSECRVEGCPSSMLR